MLRAIGDGAWVLDHPLRMPGGIDIGTRSTWLRLSDGSLLVHAPGPLTRDDLAAVAALGSVSAVVAPNRFHHLFLEDARQHFPDARFHVVPALLGKYPALSATALGDEPDPSWSGVLEQVAVAGVPRLEEVVFFHPASRTLMLVDLCFNVQRASNRRTRIFLAVADAWCRFGPSRLARSFIRDKAALRSSLDRVLEWDFDRVVVTHGDVLETGGREALRDAFAWL